MNKSSLRLGVVFLKKWDHELRKICPTRFSEMEKYSMDFMRRQGQPSGVLLPTNSSQVSEALRYCNKERIPIVTYGGNTGLVGSMVSSPGELILSLEKLNQIVELDQESSIVTVESGVILETLQTYLAGFDLTTPYDLGARGSCSIGGNVATNAGGVSFVRYGPLRGHIVGLEVVLANGTVLDLMSRCRKDNSGIDLKQVFIGSEGCLGAITKVRMHCPGLAKFRSVGFFLLNNSSFVESVIAVLEQAKHVLGETVSAFEFVDSAGLDLVRATSLINSDSRYAILIELASVSSDLESKLELLVAALPGIICDGVIESRPAQMRSLWEMRESIPVRMASLGPNMKFDISMPLPEYYTLVELVRERFKRGVKTVTGYGHVADGNLHLNIACEDDIEIFEKTKSAVSGFVYKYVVGHGGSISAEHGIGRDKLSLLGLDKSADVIHYMQALKKVFDPNGILNRGRTVPG